MPVATVWPGCRWDSRLPNTMYSAQNTPAKAARAMPPGSSAPAPPPSGNSRASPATAKPMQAKWTGFLEWIRARDRGPMNSMAMASPRGMVRRDM